MACFLTTDIHTNVWPARRMTISRGRALTAILDKLPGAPGLSCFGVLKSYFTSTFVRIHG